MAEIETVLIPDDTGLETPMNTRKRGVKFMDSSTSFSTIAETPFADTPGSLHVNVMDDSLLSSKTPTSRRLRGEGKNPKDILQDLETPPRFNSANRKFLMSRMTQQFPSPEVPRGYLSPSISEVTESPTLKERKGNVFSPNSTSNDMSTSHGSIKPNLLFKENETKKARTFLSFRKAPAPVTPEADSEKRPAPRNPRKLPDTPESQPGRIIPNKHLRDDASWCASSVCPFDCVEDYQNNSFSLPHTDKDEKPNDKKRGTFFSFLKKGSVSKKPVIESTAEIPRSIDYSDEPQQTDEHEDTEAGNVKAPPELDETVAPSRSYESDEDPNPTVAAGARVKSYHRPRRCGKRLLFYVFLPALLLSIIVLAGVLVKRMLIDKEESSITVTTTVQTSAPSEFTDDVFFQQTEAPDNVKPPGGFFDSSNPQCGTSKELKATSMIYDSMSQTTWDDSANACGDSMEFGFSSWYFVEVEESTFMEASTCDAATFDTQITVMSGHCGFLNCVTFNDNECGDQSRVTWYAEKGETYFVVVSGYRDDWGEYTLTMQPTSINDQCIEAGAPVELGSAISGTTAGSTTEDLASCGDVDTSKPGVWYEVSNIDGTVLADVMARGMNFAGQVSVYDGTCDTLTCAAGSKSGSVSWAANRDTTYHVYVNGIETEGDFDLYVGLDQDDTCSDATSLQPSFFAFIGDTRDERHHDVPSCGFTGSRHSAPGKWFAVSGTGNGLKASTCSSGTDLDTEISLFRGSCDALECITGTGEALSCGEGGSIAWETDVDDEYFIYVSGRGSRVGEFWLTIEEVDLIGTMCTKPLSLGYSIPMEISGSTDSGSAEVVEIGGDVGSARGVWYEMTGTGNLVELSACESQNGFDARVSVFTGDCDEPESIGQSAKCGEEGDYVEWDSTVGDDYHIFVHGADEEETGEFVMSLKHGGELNDRCAIALPIDSVTNLYVGSTLEATLGEEIDAINAITSAPSTSPSEAPGKGVKPNNKGGKDNRRTQEVLDSCNFISPSRGLWYKIVGNGGEIIVSTCSVETDFDTAIDVLSGGCGELQCIASNNDSCGAQSLVRFTSEVDVPYFVHVRGVNATEVGQFSLGVTVRNPVAGV
jgi:hypothetical protein